MAWIYLLVAGFFEIVWAFGLKQSLGWTKLWPSVWTLAALILSFSFLSQALKTIPMGTAYAVWMGIGAVGTAIVGMFFLGESREAGRVFCLFLIVAGIVGLKFFGSK